MLAHPSFVFFYPNKGIIVFFTEVIHKKRKEMVFISEFTLKIALLFLPGLICYIVIEKLTFHKKHDFYQIALYSYILGLLSYGCYYTGILLLNNIFGYNLNFVFTSSLTDGSVKFNLIWNEIISVSVMSIFVGLVISFIANHDHLYKLLRLMKITKKGPCEDVWLGTMTKGWLPYVEITDFKNDRTYIGWIDSFSEYDQKEVLLRDVIVEEQKSKRFLFKTPAIYIPLTEDFIIEFTSAEYSEEPATPERSETNVKPEQTTTASKTAAATTTVISTTPNNS